MEQNKADISQLVAFPPYRRLNVVSGGDFKGSSSAIPPRIFGCISRESLRKKVPVYVEFIHVPSVKWQYLVNGTVDDLVLLYASLTVLTFHLK